MNKNIKNVLLTGFPFGLFMGIFFSFRYGATRGIPAGIISGILFGISMSIFMAYQTKKFKKNPPLLENEYIIKEGPANHFKNIEGVGGWAYLTDKSFIFKSHSVNIQTHELIIPIQKIKDVKLVLTIGFIPNGLKIITIDGNNERFVVENRKDWVTKILELKNKNS